MPDLHARVNGVRLDAIRLKPDTTQRFQGAPVPTLDLWSMLFVFMLATFVGFQVIQNVSRLLHTPLMSLTNAISAIAVVGAILDRGRAGVAPHARSSAPSPSPRR